MQMIQLQKAISAVGMFSIFDAILQDQLQCENGFRKASQILDSQGATDLEENFLNLQLAVNVLKHGRGPSYDKLVQKAATLPFKIKSLDKCFFNEGDISEISTLIEVDDAFVSLCAKTIDEVFAYIQKQ
ncbi:MAG: hypothetical protein WCR69_09305 [Sulfuricurvum sp.]